jgi:cobalt-precorrin-5B (C1)-methyltransferase
MIDDGGGTGSNGGDRARLLRRGWTTGTCATAAASSAYQALVTGRFADPVTVALPRGGVAVLPLHRAERAAATAIASVIKDAGDDPDVTHGAEIVASVAPAPAGAGVVFRAGEGVGTVTLPGLPLAVGEPAINPGPRAMIRRAIADVAAACGGAGDVTVTLAIPGGEALAEKTLNGRLGIRGGLSVLGTTGIVVPFSCAAWIHSIHRGIDVARASGLAHLAAATGSVSEQAARRLYGLPEAALIDMGDFAGGTLKYLRRHPVARLTLAGGFGKLAKLAQGRLFLHSATSRVDLPALIEMMADLGAPADALAAARAASTAAHVLAIARHDRLPLAGRVAAAARGVTASLVAPETAVDVAVFDRTGELIGHAGP